MLLKIDADSFKINFSNIVSKQKIKAKPVAYHYENQGEKPYIKYSCPICSQFYCICDSEQHIRFGQFSFPEGTKNCPCCGINLDWNE